MGYLSDNIRRLLLHINRLLYTLERMGIITITKEDLIRWRGPHFAKEIRYGQEGQDLIGRGIAQESPFMVVRLGQVELNCLRFYLQHRLFRKKPYTAKIRHSMSNNAGFFPTDDDSLDRFCKIFLQQLQKADLMAVWFYKYEWVFCNDFSDADLIDSDCLEPFRFASPWSSMLAGSKVLVIHPFAETIQRQYRENRQFLFPSTEILPEFELKTLKAVQSSAGAPVGFSDWFEAYEDMCNKMSTIDFDICIIGAGAYGVPLAGFAKSLGKRAVQLGGATQILFGIKGRRWELEYAHSTAKLFNDHWVRPSLEETPAGKDKVESGCYW